MQLHKHEAAECHKRALPHRDRLTPYIVSFFHREDSRCHCVKSKFSPLRSPPNHYPQGTTLVSIVHTTTYTSATKKVRGKSISQEETTLFLYPHIVYYLNVYIKSPSWVIVSSQANEILGPALRPSLLVVFRRGGQWKQSLLFTLC